MIKKEQIKIVYKTSFTTLSINILLATTKFVAGFFGNSKALISDAIHSIADALTTIIVMIGVTISKKDADEDHPYGHEKFESITSLILAMILMLTATYIAIDGISLLIDFANGNLNIVEPSIFALVIAALSIVTKEVVFRYTKKQANKIDSQAMLADAWHQRSDALSSIGSLIGIGLSLIGFLYFDILASLFISLLIFKVGFDIFKKTVNQIVDKAPTQEIINDIKTFIENIEGVESVDRLNISLHVNKLFIDVEIGIYQYQSFIDAHEITEQVYELIYKKYPKVKHCMIHANPSEIKKDEKQ
jgi:cation diffusion facilitator family transporter